MWGRSRKPRSFRQLGECLKDLCSTQLFHIDSEIYAMLAALMKLWKNVWKIILKISSQRCERLITTHCLSNTTNCDSETSDDLTALILYPNLHAGFVTFDSLNAICVQHFRPFHIFRPTRSLKYVSSYYREQNKKLCFYSSYRLSHVVFFSIANRMRRTWNLSPSLS